MTRPILPFPSPFPLNIGTDICHIPRILDILTSPRGGRFIRRVFAPEELARPKKNIAAVLNSFDNGAGTRAFNSGGLRHQNTWRHAATFMAGR